jgi:hypothetical protein
MINLLPKRKILSTLIILFGAGRLSAQQFIQYLSPDSAHYVILHAKSEQERFHGYYGLDRYYYTTGLYDSSRYIQAKMYAIAKSANSDPLLADTHHAIGNMLVHKSDYNFSLSNYFRALEYAKDDYRKARSYAAAAYVYMLTGNDELGLKFVRKADSIITFSFEKRAPYIKKVVHIFSGVAFTHLNKPDSALLYLQKAETDATVLDATMNAVLFGSLSLNYELKREDDLADLYYKKTLAFCKTEKLVFLYIRNANHYCNYLLKKGDYINAKTLALKILSVATQTIGNDGLSNVAASLKKIYSHAGNKDSAFYYAEMQIAYQDSMSNQKRIAEFQNITFAQQLKEIDEQTRVQQDAEQRQHNIQFALIALGIITFTILFLLLARSIIVNEKWIEFLGVLGLLIVFEFINLIIHPYLAEVTHDSPVFMLMILVVIAAVLIPLHHKLEIQITGKMVEKNKKIRVAAAKKIIEKLGNDKNNL